MRTILSLILLAAAIRLPLHRDVSKLPPSVRASLPADFDPAREALAGVLPDAGTVTILAPPQPLPTDGGAGTIAVVEQAAMCHGQVAGDPVKPALDGVLYRVPRNIGAVRFLVKQQKVEVCGVQRERRRDPDCVCQGIALSAEQRRRGIHICAGCLAP